jgi:tRNA(adenine34) deaminase
VSSLTHRIWMDEALAEAREAEAHGDVPVGALVVHQGRAIARAHNERELRQDPTAHAEMLALRRAARELHSWRLADCIMYVTLEPCAMCAGALVLARLPILVFGATDPKAGAVGSLMDIARDERLNHRVHVVSGVRDEECGGVLRRFFHRRRTAARTAVGGDNFVGPGPTRHAEEPWQSLGPGVRGG